MRRPILLIVYHAKLLTWAETRNVTRTRASLLKIRSSLAATLSLAKFVTITAIKMVTLCCAT
jgi:hypothetical protein